MNLPPIVQTALPIMQTLNDEQKLFIVKNLFDDRLDDKLDNRLDDNLAWQAGQGVFGVYKSGQSDLSQNAKLLVQQKIQAKYGKNTH